MKLSYTDLLGDGERHEINATITTEHAASSYGQPVILIDSGPLDLSSWVLLDYKVVEANQDETLLLRKFFGNLNFALSAAVEPENDSSDAI